MEMFFSFWDIDVGLRTNAFVLCDQAALYREVGTVGHGGRQKISTAVADAPDLAFTQYRQDRPCQAEITVTVRRRAGHEQKRGWLSGNCRDHVYQAVRSCR
jgi:hypothetical protein